jgi:flagellar basal-body rod protein FlgF
MAHAEKTMANGLYAVVSGSLAQERRLDVLAHNLANVNTAGFKADVPVFEVIAAPPPLIAPGFPSMQPLQSSPSMPILQESYVGFTGVKADLSAGEFRSTGNPLDVAINGKGWFSIETSAGTRYTRNGSFSLNHEGQLVTQDGWPVIGNNGPIALQGNVVKIDSHGGIIVDGQEVDQLKIVTPPAENAFQKAENALFAAPPGPAVEEVGSDLDVKQGYVELSNVNAIKGMTALIDAMRAYESYQKVLQTWSETTARTVNDVGRLR